MAFSENQLRALRRNPDSGRLKTRMLNGRELTYLEGWHIISEANRIFGFENWDRETIEAKCVLAREIRGEFCAVYIARVRITVRAETTIVVREGQGSGEARNNNIGETHDVALKAAETDATKRALATFGRPFGLGLYISPRTTRRPIPNPGRRPVARSQVASTPRPELRTRISEIPAPPPDGRPVSDPGQPAADSPDPPPDIPRVDKTELVFGEPRRRRDKAHLRYVSNQPCLLCGRLPSDAHHLRFVQPRAMGRKVSDEFTVPLCRTHHRQLHQSRDEAAWWKDLDIDPLAIADGLWAETRILKTEQALPDTQPAKHGQGI